MTNAPPPPQRNLCKLVEDCWSQTATHRRGPSRFWLSHSDVPENWFRIIPSPITAVSGHQSWISSPAPNSQRLRNMHHPKTKTARINPSRFRGIVQPSRRRASIKFSAGDSTASRFPRRTAPTSYPKETARQGCTAQFTASTTGKPKNSQKRHKDTTGHDNAHKTPRNRTDVHGRSQQRNGSPRRTPTVARF